MFKTRKTEHGRHWAVTPVRRAIDFASVLGNLGIYGPLPTSPTSCSFSSSKTKECRQLHLEKIQSPISSRYQFQIAPLLGMVLCIHFPFSVLELILFLLVWICSCLVHTVSLCESICVSSCCVWMTVWGGVIHHFNYGLCSLESPKVSDYVSFGVFSSQYSTYVTSCSCLKFLILKVIFAMPLDTLQPFWLYQY